MVIYSSPVRGLTLMISYTTYWECTKCQCVSLNISVHRIEFKLSFLIPIGLDVRRAGGPGEHPGQVPEGEAAARPRGHEDGQL